MSFKINLFLIEFLLLIYLPIFWGKGGIFSPELNVDERRIAEVCVNHTTLSG